MTIEEIVHGESRNVEFKVTLPRNSEKYVKSVIAFANTQGGRLIFGVDDKTRKATGAYDKVEFSEYLKEVREVIRRETMEKIGSEDSDGGTALK